ncbi:MAG: hypothetical protein KUG71_12360 [Porticoccaceae bacterium]|nr:hypothetical protein [Porticoccaceae bacterium]
MRKKFGNNVIVLAAVLLVSTGVWAKPDGQQGGGAGKRPDNSMQKSPRMDGDDAREELHERRRDEEYRREKSKEMESKREHRGDDDASGLAKQREMKINQEQKELGRGSEKGQEAREENSRKWWKIWE